MLPSASRFIGPAGPSAIERDEEAGKLAARLEAHAAADPGIPQVVIAHSHGGNIALAAARQYRKDAKPTNVITLATPFLDAVPLLPEKAHESYGSEAYWSMQLKDMKVRSVGLACAFITLYLLNCAGVPIASAFRGNDWTLKSLRWAPSLS